MPSGCATTGRNSRRKSKLGRRRNKKRTVIESNLFDLRARPFPRPFFADDFTKIYKFDVLFARKILKCCSVFLF
jgi:hypothetical protein